MDETQIDLIRESFSSLVNHPCFIAICDPKQNFYKWNNWPPCLLPPQSRFNEMKFNHLEDELNQKIKYLKNLQGTIKEKFEDISILVQKHYEYLENLVLGSKKHHDFQRNTIEILHIISIQDEIFDRIFKKINIDETSAEEIKQYLSQIELYLNRNLLHFEMSIQSLIEQMSSLLKNHQSH